MAISEENPSPRKSSLKFRIVFLVGIAIFFTIKFASPSWTTAVFYKGQFATLNQIVDVKTNQDLNFYIGRMQEIIFGPLTQLISGLLFAWLCLKYFRNAGRWKFGLAVFAFLLITKMEVLLFPPYGDAIGGPFAEALWLSQNSFNYVGLFHQPSYDAGGQRVYLFSIYPTYLAVFLKLIPWTKAFLIVQHSIVFALASAMVVMLRECFLKVFDSTTATLSALLFLSLPLIQSQVEAINMEIPAAFCMLWSAYALINRQNGLSCVLAILSALIKGTGITACGAAALIIFFNLWQERSLGMKMRLLLWSVVAAGSAVFLVSLKFIFKDAHISEGMVHWAAGWPSLKNEFIFYLYLVCAVIFLVAFLFKIRHDRAGAGDSDSRKNFYVPAIMFLFAGMWFLLFLNFYAVSPRYRVVLYPFLIFSVIYVVTIILRWRFARIALLWLGLAAGCLSSYGFFYGTMPDNDHVMLERSLEYRNDFTLNRRLINLLEDKYSDRLIVAPFILAQMMAIPQLGYVQKPLDIMIYGFSLKYGGIRNYPGLEHFDYRRAVFIGVKVSALPDNFPYPMGPRDILLDELLVGNKRATVFMGGIYIDTLWRITHNVGARSMKY